MLTFTFLNPVITAGHKPPYLKEGAPLHAAYPNPVLRHSSSAGWKGNRELLNAGPCFLNIFIPIQIEL